MKLLFGIQLIIMAIGLFIVPDSEFPIYKHNPRVYWGGIVVGISIGIGIGRLADYKREK